jgi:hypothetical protein
MKDMPPDVAAVFRGFPANARKRLLALRALIFESAEKARAGAVEETLKWGEPAYRTKGGSTVRLGWKEKSPGEAAMYFICTTNLVDTFRELYPDRFRFGGNRALLFDLTSRLPAPALRHCIALALTYRSRAR